MWFPWRRSRPSIEPRGADSQGVFEPGAAVVVLDPHDVVELRGGNLEEEGVRDGAEAMHRAGGDVPRIPRPHRHDRRLRVPAEHQLERPGLHEERFVLLLVVLKAQLRAGFDEENLPRIPVGLDEAQLVPPRLVHARHAHAGFSSTSRTARAISVARIASRTRGTARGGHDSSRSPKPSSVGTRSGLAAISPQRVTGMPRDFPARTTKRTIRRTAGCRGSYSGATDGFPRSTARVYWMRSLVPRLRKSSSRERW